MDDIEGTISVEEVAQLFKKTPISIHTHNSQVILF